MNHPPTSDIQKKSGGFWVLRCCYLPSLGGFEPPAFRLGGERSILLSYRDNYEFLKALNLTISTKNFQSPSSHSILCYTPACYCSLGNRPPALA